MQKLKYKCRKYYTYICLTFFRYVELNISFNLFLDTEIFHNDENSKLVILLT